MLYFKFEMFIMNGFEVMASQKSVDGQTDGRTDGQAETYIPLVSRGIMTSTFRTQ